MIAREILLLPCYQTLLYDLKTNQIYINISIVWVIKYVFSNKQQTLSSFITLSILMVLEIENYSLALVFGWAHEATCDRIFMWLWYLSGWLWYLHRSDSKKFCPKILRRQISVDVVSGQNRSNRFKMSTIKKFKQRYVLNGFLLNQSHKLKAGKNCKLCMFWVFFIHLW